MTEENHEYEVRCKTCYTKFTDYIGFWGGLLNPLKDPEIRRFCNQLS